MNNICPECKNNLLYVETLEVATKKLMKGIYENNKPLFEIALKGMKILISEKSCNLLHKDTIPVLDEAITEIAREDTYKLMKQNLERYQKFFQDRLAHLREVMNEDVSNLESKKITYNLREEYQAIGEAFMGKQDEPV